MNVFICAAMLPKRVPYPKIRPSHLHSTSSALLSSRGRGVSRWVSRTAQNDDSKTCDQPQGAKPAWMLKCDGGGGGEALGQAVTLGGACIFSRTEASKVSGTCRRVTEGEGRLAEGKLWVAAGDRNTW